MVVWNEVSGNANCELKDLQGNRLEARYEWSFETRTLAPGMVPIWPGRFVMGSPRKPPAREVTMSQSITFSITKSLWVNIDFVWKLVLVVIQNQMSHATGQ